MLFNSLEFALYLPIVFGLYWFVFNKNLRLQNLLVLAASYFFYGWWDWRFLSLIILSSVIDFFIGQQLGKEAQESKRKVLLGISLAVNLGLLGFFKYCNFFLESFVDAFTFFGGKLEVDRLDIVLPVGISFYTFQTLSYTIDVFRKKLIPSKDPIAFFAFVSFFPQLVAGPIERASNLLPQFLLKRKFDYDQANNGLRQMLWGLFKKVVIADNCAQISNLVFADPSAYGGSTLLLGVTLFTVQIYCDFSGYSDIAIGLARLFGFKLMQNFAFPFFSRDIAEFWRRWHISLSTWFRDYLYIPLGGSRGGNKMRIRNTFIIFIVSGFWHGANWTYIFWGALNAFYILPLLLMGTSRLNMEIVAKGGYYPNLKEAFQIFFTFMLCVLAFVFFRSPSMSASFEYLSIIFSSSFFTMPTLFPSLTLFFIGFLFVIEWLAREQQFALDTLLNRFPTFMRWSFYFLIVFAILKFGGAQETFIYFQF